MRILQHLSIALILALALVPISSKAVVAQGLQDYFSYRYDVAFSKTQVLGSEVFYVTITVEAICNKTLPMPVSEAEITGHIIARHEVSGAEVLLNKSYTIKIKPFPSRAGQTTRVSASIPLQFPPGSQSGSYSVIGKLDRVEGKVFFTRIPATSFLPSSQVMGTVTYTLANEPSRTPAEVGIKRPAAFVASELSITPAEVDIGEGVIISAIITNTGDVAGSCKITLKINNEETASDELTLEGGVSEEITFAITKDVAGIYTVAVDGLSGTFVVGIPSGPINWWLLSGIIAASIALAGVISLTVIRRRRV